MTNMVGVADSDDWLGPSNACGICPKDFPTVDGIMGGNFPCTIADIKDGTSNTLMIGEVTGGPKGSYLGWLWMGENLGGMRFGINGIYTEIGGHFPGSGYPFPPGVTQWNAGFSSYHPGGCHFLLADGSVQFLSQNINQNLLTALTTRDGATYHSTGLPDQVLVSGVP